MKGKKVVAVVVFVCLALSIALFSMVIPAKAGRGGDLARLEMMATPETPAGFEGATGTITFNTTGVTLKFTLKASGLPPGEDYIVAFCGMIVGAGTSDSKGALKTWGSANDNWYMWSHPSDNFELYRVSDLPIYDVQDFERVLESPPSGYTGRR